MLRKKCLIMFVLLLLLPSLFISPSVEAEEDNSIGLIINGVYMLMTDDFFLYMDTGKGAIYASSLLFSSSLNTEVDWNDYNNTVSFRVNDTNNEVTYKINQKQVVINGVAKPLTTPAVIRDPDLGLKDTMVPLRTTIESLGGSLTWDHHNKVIDLKTSWRIPVLEFGGNWEPYGIQVNIAPQIFKGITIKDGKINVRLPQIEGKNVHAHFVEGPDPTNGKVTELVPEETYIFDAEYYSLLIQIGDPELYDSYYGDYDEYYLYSESVLKNLSNYVKGDVSVFDRYHNMIPLSRVYEALDITP
ncbi:copper amine oxidase N-terminal domain-containing protein [Paenibacillus massiliensis]|uniref:copper amine oxidase N-terminal domain-containing protein n=1 Tax=Paenibacillus massiliensis TaxID=225917 RepID=UPI00041DB72C|nr:copper amine oxidase N-terminal domain-containing protein [Paenibacillus massiliensis]